MTRIQQSLITKYKKSFPEETFKQISIKTGIQLTRAFRIFNGAEMKLSEYESINNALKTISQFSVIDFRAASGECEIQLSSEQLNEMVVEMNYLLETKRSMKC